MKSTFKVLFYLKKGSEKKNGEVMIMACSSHLKRDPGSI